MLKNNQNIFWLFPKIFGIFQRLQSAKLRLECSGVNTADGVSHNITTDLDEKHILKHLRLVKPDIRVG